MNTVMGPTTGASVRPFGAGRCRQPEYRLIRQYRDTIVTNVAFNSKGDRSCPYVYILAGNMSRSFALSFCGCYSFVAIKGGFQLFQQPDFTFCILITKIEVRFFRSLCCYNSARIRCQRSRDGCAFRGYKGTRSSC